jgi:hypothetical protein
VKIESNMNVSGVNGTTPPSRPATSAKTARDTASFSGAAGVDASLASLPDSRPEAVAKAKQLINDPDYPSSQTVKQLAQFLTPQLLSENENE